MMFRKSKAPTQTFEFEGLTSRLMNYKQYVLNDINVLVDIGCSDGRFIESTRPLFPNLVRTIGVDPIDSYSQRVDYERFIGLIGSECRDITFSVSDDLYTSSKLYPGVREVISTQFRLDCLLEKQEVSDSSKIFLKIDTQGCDLECLESAGGYLSAISIALVEIQLRPFSEGMRYFSQSVEIIRSLGFEVCEIVNPLFRDHDKTLGQVDLLIAPINSEIFLSTKW